MHNLAATDPQRSAQLQTLWEKWWSDKNPGLLRAAGTEPVYRRPFDANEGTQGGNDEPDQAAPKARKKKL